MERLAVVHGQLGRPHAGLRIVAVDVEDRRADHLGDVGAVFGGPGMFGCGGEADLIVDHDVHGAAGAITGQQRQVERLGHHALTGERGVAVQHERQDGELLGLLELVLLDRTRPSRTGSTASRWLGLAVKGDDDLVVAEHLVVYPRRPGGT